MREQHRVAPGEGGAVVRRPRVAAQELQAAPARPEEEGEEHQERRLSGAVRTDEGQDLAGADVERVEVEREPGRRRRVGEAEAFEAIDGVAHPTTPCRGR